MVISRVILDRLDDSGNTGTGRLWLAASARTFGFLDDVERLRKHGYALGGSLDNAIVLDRFEILNKDGLRYPDEFVRHKILDFVGDLALLGMPIIDRFVIHRSGHTLNHKMLRNLLASRSSWVCYRTKDLPV